MQRVDGLTERNSKLKIASQALEAYLATIVWVPFIVSINLVLFNSWDHVIASTCSMFCFHFYPTCLFSTSSLIRLFRCPKCETNQQNLLWNHSHYYVLIFSKQCWKDPCFAITQINPSMIQLLLYGAKCFSKSCHHAKVMSIAPLQDVAHSLILISSHGSFFH